MCEVCIVAERDAITEHTEAGIYNDWGKESLERVTLNVTRFPEQGCILNPTMHWIRCMKWNSAPGADCFLSAT